MEERLKLIPCPEGHTVLYKRSEGPINRKGQDYDLYYYDVLDGAGTVVSSYVVKDSMGTYPPFNQSLTVEKV